MAEAEINPKRLQPQIGVNKREDTVGESNQKDIERIT